MRNSLIVYCRALNNYNSEKGFYTGYHKGYYGGFLYRRLHNSTEVLGDIIL